MISYGTNPFLSSISQAQSQTPDTLTGQDPSAAFLGGGAPVRAGGVPAAFSSGIVPSPGQPPVMPPNNKGIWPNPPQPGAPPPVLPQADPRLGYQYNQGGVRGPVSYAPVQAAPAFSRMTGGALAGSEGAIPAVSSRVPDTGKLQSETGVLNAPSNTSWRGSATPEWLKQNLKKQQGMAPTNGYGTVSRVLPYAPQS